MFYADPVDYNQLRFGDVLSGFILATPTIEEPLSTDKEHNYQVDFSLPSLSIILSPCCSISERAKDGIIVVSPLIRIRVSFFDNPYFHEDLTRINRVMEPEQSVLPSTWEKLSETEKAKRKTKKLSYALLDFFIYQNHKQLPPYEMSNARHETFKTNYYMIDFRNTFKVSCEDLKRNKEKLLAAKLIQLSVETRKELRDKIAFYYGRTPEEDQILLAGA
jgi:hypothetical protein